MKAEVKTKNFVNVMNTLALTRKTLFVFDGQEEVTNAFLSMRNIPNAGLIDVEGLNVYDILNADRIVFTEKAAVESEKQLLKTNFEDELQTVATYYVMRGVSEKTSLEIAQELMKKNALETIVRIKYGLELGHYMNPWNAAFSSLVSASSGGIFPLVAMTMLPVSIQWPGTIIAVILSVALTGYLSAKLGDGLTKTAIIRNVIVGIVTMCIHYYVGTML